MAQQLKSVAILAALALTLSDALLAGIFGEGFSSPEPRTPADIGFRAFTTVTGPEACAISSVPAELRVYPNPIRLDIGDRIHRSNVNQRESELVVEAYGANGGFLASVPIVVSTVGVQYVVRSQSDWDYLEAIHEGEDNLVVSWLCSGPDGARVETRVRMIVGRGNDSSK